MKKTPEIWQKANNERFMRLGAMVTRRQLVMQDLDALSRDIERLQDEILAIERTGDLAAEVEASATAKAVE